MKDFGLFLLFVIAWFVLMRWILPKMGMTT